MTTTTATDPFHADVQVYEPHFVGLPPLRLYVKEAWKRRAFAQELSRTHLRAQHFDTVFGQLWMVLNPILLALVYFVLIDIIRHGHHRHGQFAHLVAGIFAYYFISGGIREAVTSVTGGGKLILNSAFPRILLPLSSVLTAFKRFLPTLLIYIPIHLISGLPITWTMLCLVPLVALMTLLSAGFAMVVAALQVYFRDTSSFLPYLLRMWLYVSPVLYYASDLSGSRKLMLPLNPIGYMMASWSRILQQGKLPYHGWMLISCAWTLGALLLGFLFFVSREREFAVRL
jgi:teichoic acid transport system permease protein